MGSLANEINKVEVSLGIERLLVAGTGVSYTPSRIALPALPTDFRDLGAVVEDTPTFTGTREKFELDTGLPRVRQFESTVAVGGTLALSLHSNSWRKIQYAFGNYTPSASATIVTTIGSVTDRNTITLATSTTSLPVGTQFIISTTTLGLDYADAVESRVASIESDTLTYHLSPTPISTPTAGDFVAFYGVGYVDQYWGTSKTTKYQLLGVADFQDGSQVQHHVFEAVPADDFTESITPEENGRIPLSFNAFGVTKSVQGNNELVVVARYFFPGTDVSG